MMGMIQSLNVSVAAAILFYEMLRQRFLKMNIKNQNYRLKNSITNLMNGKENNSFILLKNIYVKKN